MKNTFFKFPSTPHLATLEGLDVRDDKVFSAEERDDFLRHQLVVEEKIDGANLGISFDADGNLILQNRGAHLQLPAAGQWKKLEQWLDPKMDSLFEALTDQYILFGEWCYAQHSVFYDRLPDWFVGFDLFDKKAEEFLSVARRDDLLRKVCVCAVPLVAKGQYSFSDVQGLMAQSKFSDAPAEGLYFRVEREDWLLKRAKLVRSSFIQSVQEHWSRATIKPNQLDSKAWAMLG